MRKDVTVPAEARDTRGKNEARRLRAIGSMPAIVYGGDAAPEAVTVNPKEVARILNSKTGHNTIFNLDLKGTRAPVMIIDWQYDPIRDSLLHVDLKRIDLTRRITVKVPVVTHGEPRGVKLQGGLHEIVTREIEVECLPDDIPEQFVVQVSDLGLGDSVRVGDLSLSGSLKLITATDAVISHVVALKAEVEAAVPASEAPAGAAEPEVIKKGKKEEGGESAAPKKK